MRVGLTKHDRVPAASVAIISGYALGSGLKSIYSTAVRG
jgi:hypothetical protein